MPYYSVKFFHHAQGMCAPDERTYPAVFAKDENEAREIIIRGYFPEMKGESDKDYIRGCLTAEKVS